MKTIQLQDVRIRMQGITTAPVDLLEVARSTLKPETFESLMNKTGWRAPTRAELCAAADEERIV